MHGVIAYTGGNPERFQQLRLAAEHFGASNIDTRNTGNNWLGSFGSVNVVHAFSDANGVGAVYGSAASTADFFTDHFLDAAPDDVVGCVIHTSWGSLLPLDAVTIKCSYTM